MANQHSGHPFSLRVPGDVLAGFRARVAANNTTQTAVLTELMRRYGDGEITIPDPEPVERAEV